MLWYKAVIHKFGFTMIAALLFIVKMLVSCLSCLLRSTISLLLVKKIWLLAWYLTQLLHLSFLFPLVKLRMCIYSRVLWESNGGEDEDFSTAYKTVLVEILPNLPKVFPPKFFTVVSMSLCSNCICHSVYVTNCTYHTVYITVLYNRPKTHDQFVFICCG